MRSDNKHQVIKNTGIFLACLMIAFSNMVMAQQKVFTVNNNDPFKKIVSSLKTESHPFFIDIDADNDLDCFAGEYANGQASKIWFYRNDGNNKTPVFKNITGAANPLHGVMANSVSIPYFIDMDDDGDYDCFISDGITGAMMYYKNTGSKTQPRFEKQSAAFNPLGMVKFSAAVIADPAFADIDGDGDYDCLITDEDGNESYFKNTGDRKHPVFEHMDDAGDPFAFLRSEPVYNVSLYDWDHDGLVDLFVNTTYYKNTGTANRPAFGRDKYDEPVFENKVAAQYTYTPLRWTDLDNDGSPEVFRGSTGGSFIYQTLSSQGINNAALAAKPLVGIHVFPNPAKEEFELTISAKQPAMTVLRVTDVQGKTVTTQVIYNNTAKFGKELKPGIYFVQVLQDNKVTGSQKIIKE